MAKEVTIYQLKISGTYNTEATDSNDAIAKAKEYVEANADKLDYTWKTITAQVWEED